MAPVDSRMFYTALDGVLAAAFLASGAWATLQALIHYSSWIRARSSLRSAESLPLRDRWRHAWVASSVAAFCYVASAGWAAVLVHRAINDPDHSGTRQGLLFLAGGLGCIALCGVLFLLPRRASGSRPRPGGA